MLKLAIALAALTAAPDDVDDPARATTWEGFQGANSLTCVGIKEAMAQPEVRTHAGWEYTFEGWQVRVKHLKGSVPLEHRFGVLSGIKELDGATKRVVDSFLKRFAEAKVDFLLIGGDSGEDQTGLEEVFAYLAKQDLPTFVIAGNWEGRAPFNRALRSVSKDHPNMVNMDLARRADLEGVDLISLGGYMDRAYVKGTGACVYQKDDAASVAEFAQEADDPVVLLAHGPARQAGPDAIDYVPGAGNVGDEDLATAIGKAGIKFGISGHILEAGARGVDDKGKMVKEGRFSPSLFLNPGPATALPWKLNAGGTSHGLAAILTVKGAKASYEVLRAGKSEEPQEE